MAKDKDDTTHSTVTYVHMYIYRNSAQTT